MSEQAVTILLVDEHALVRLGTRSLLAAHPGFTVVGEAGTMAQALDEATRATPDVVVMGTLPDGSGALACLAIGARLPQAHIIMLTDYANEASVIAAINAGAAGYLLKEAAPRLLIDAITIAMEGGALLDPVITPIVLRWIRATTSAVGPDPLVELSVQERRILQLLAEGRTNPEIAETLCLSKFTVKAYVSRIFRKLRISRRAQAAALAPHL